MKDVSAVKRSIDHVGFTVPDLDQAVEFFRDGLGCELVLTEGTYDNCGYIWPGESEPEKATVRLAILRHGDSLNIELLEYREPESGVRDDPPRPSERGAGHLAFHVDDIESAASELSARDGVRMLGAIETETGAMAGLKWVYAMTAWGMVVELINWPIGMPYEQTTSARLVPPRWRGAADPTRA
jgi:catechol 2,3-dioxygenase-like lactoylglutathione lyase family enzyme